MSTDLLQAHEQFEVNADDQPRQKWVRRLGLMPQPFSLVLTLLYLLVLSGMAYGAGRSLWSWQGLLGLSAVLLLLLTDWLDYRVWSNTTPAWTGVVLLGFRIVLIEVVAWLPVDRWNALFLYAVVPFFASLHFGPTGSLAAAAIVWLCAIGQLTLKAVIAAPGTVERSYYVSDLAWFSVVLIAAATIARIIDDEKRNRVRAEGMLVELERSHTQLQATAAETLAATQERSRLTREIHRSLGQYLSELRVQLGKALAFREIDPRAADQAISDSKQVAAEALQEVRRSISTLRIPQKTIVAAVTPGEIADPAPPTHHQRGWRFWLLPRPFLLVPSLVYLGLLVSYFREMGSELALWSWQNALVTGILLLLPVVDRLEYGYLGEAPSGRSGLLMVVLRLMLFAPIFAVIGPVLFVVLVPLLPYIVYYGTRAGLRLAVLLWIVFTGLFTYDAIRAESVAQIISMAKAIGFATFLLLLVIATARALRGEREQRKRAEGLLADLRQTHRQLKAAAEQALSAMQTRNHLAREIHDGVGHYLTVINVQLEKALAYRRIDPNVADRAVSDARRLAVQALQDVRGTIGTLDATRESFSLATALRQLASNMGASLQVDLRILGSEDGFSKQALIVLYRVVQEGLTNIQKHAGATQAKASLTFEDRAATLDLADNGRGFDLCGLQALQPNRDRHFGLQGMRERLELVGGSLELEARPGAGTRLHVTVPKAALIRSEWTSEQAEEAEL